MKTIPLFKKTDHLTEYVSQVLQPHFTHLTFSQISEGAGLVAAQLPHCFTPLKTIRGWAKQCLLEVFEDELPASTHELSISLSSTLCSFNAPCSIEDLEMWLSKMQHHTQSTSKALMVISLLRKLKDAGLEETYGKPVCGDKAFVKLQANRLSSGLKEVFGITVSKGKALDLYANLLGKPSGFQQLKPTLDPILDRYELTPFMVSRLLEVVDHTEPADLSFEKARLLTQQALSQIKENYLPGSLIMQLYAAWFDVGVEILPTTLKPTSHGERWIVRLSQTLVSHLFILINGAGKRAEEWLPRPTLNNSVCWFAAKTTLCNIEHDDDALDDLIKVYSKGDDGFTLSRSLERYHGWSMSRDDMEDLDTMDEVVNARMNDAERLWHESAHCLQTLAVGTQIKEGLITDICNYTPGAYLVKKPGHDDDKNGYSRRVIKFEHARVAVSS